MAIIVLSPSNVLNSPEAGGHFWVYLQYARGFLEAGCEVYWLEGFRSGGDAAHDSARVAELDRRIQRYAPGVRILCYPERDEDCPANPPVEYLGMSRAAAEAVFRHADLLLNFRYAIAPGVLGLFRRTALVDIDPGLLQFWIHVGQVAVPRHDLYFTTGETVGTPEACFPDCGLPWVHIRPAVSLDLWPPVEDVPATQPFTTVSSWWGGGDVRGEWVTDGKGLCYDNSKRASFLAFRELPRRSDQPLELALDLADSDPEGQQAREPLPDLSTFTSSLADYRGDGMDRRIMEHCGWRVRHSREVAGTPASYQAYIQASRGEFSCAKRSCTEFRSAWVSDRTLCYLASGKPAVVQDTGPSGFLPDGEGLFRFSTVEQAADALAEVNANYQRHCRAAREIAAAFFDARQVVERILGRALT